MNEKNLRKPGKLAHAEFIGVEEVYKAAENYRGNTGHNASN